MARKPAWPRMSGANPAIKTPKAPADTRMHRRSIYCYGDSMSDGFEIWAVCGAEPTNPVAQTTDKVSDVTCAACRREWREWANR